MSKGEVDWGNTYDESRFITVCHMWSCRHPNGEEEEELMLSTEEKEVQPIYLFILRPRILDQESVENKVPK